MQPISLTVVTAVMLASIACAQNQGTGIWLWDVTTQDGDATVIPGETATVSLFMDLDPSVGDRLSDGFTVLGFGGGFADFLGGKNADKGQIVEWTLNSALDNGSDGTTDGVNIFDIELGQIPLDPFDASDPIFLLSIEWQPLIVAKYSVEYSALIEHDSMPGFLIWKGIGLDPVVTEFWSAQPAEITFAVIPTPVTSLLPLACWRFLARRCRSSL